MFPTNDELETRITHSTKYQKFKDLPINIWYKIINIKNVPTKNGEAMIINLSDEKSNEITVWATSVIKRIILPENEYIRYVGLKQTQNGKYFYNFDIV